MIEEDQEPYTTSREREEARSQAVRAKCRECSAAAYLDGRKEEEGREDCWWGCRGLFNLECETGQQEHWQGGQREVREMTDIRMNGPEDVRWMEVAAEMCGRPYSEIVVSDGGMRSECGKVEGRPTTQPSSCTVNQHNVSCSIYQRKHSLPQPHVDPTFRSTNVFHAASILSSPHTALPSLLAPHPHTICLIPVS